MSKRLIHLLRVVVLSLPFMAGAAYADVHAGQVTFSIGESFIERGEVKQPVRKGDSIHSGDVLRTSNNGHVHIRFADDSRVSVRPDSLFRIVEFVYDPADPTASTVRFKLDQGDVRSISGEAAKAARERFRLNTPLVAIGVKGTDFVTQVDTQSTRIYVNQGAIVSSPFTNGCSMAGLGACAGADARELSAEMGKLLVYKTGQVAPMLYQLPADSDVEKLHLMRDAASEDALSDERSTREAAEFVPLRDYRMLWGRWSNVPKDGDDLTLSFREAFASNDVVVGDGYYFLFREPDQTNLLPRMQGEIDLQLQASTAYFANPRGEVPATVEGGNLSLDFTQRSFATDLNVSAERVGTHRLELQGSINPENGIFSAGSMAGSDASLSGALNLDGGAAGYLFKLPAADGNFRGATLWGQP